MCGLIKPKDGKITCNNIDISQNLTKWYDGISYVSQGSRLLDETILNNIVFENSLIKNLIMQLKFQIQINLSRIMIKNSIMLWVKTDQICRWASSENYFS